MPEIDLSAVFDAIPTPTTVLTRDLVIVAVNPAYAAATHRPAEALLGRNILDVFPDDPADLYAEGVHNLVASFDRVLQSGRLDVMPLHKYDTERPGRRGAYDEHYWTTMNTPVLAADGEVELILHQAEEVTEVVRRPGHRRDRQEAAAMDVRRLEAELLIRARELQEINETLREDNVRERRVALTLQEAMLPAGTHVERAEIAVRYRPAAQTLNVCGDWYDVVELPGDRIGVAVGDVVGHGLSAACVMGQLRSALNAAVLVAEGPAEALDVLGVYARSLEGATASTAVQAVIDLPGHVITYSRAGHLPPVLAQTDGSVELLDGVVDPPLGVWDRDRHTPRTAATVEFEQGSMLVLYTDGLIERRGQDIDLAIGRLAESLGRHAGLDPDALADTLLADLVEGGSGTDDAALLVMRL